MKRLKNEADLKGSIARWILQIRNRVSAVKQRSLTRPIKRSQHLQQSRFSAAAWTGHGKEFALHHAKTDAPKGLHLTVLEFFREPYGLENISQGRYRRALQSCHWTEQTIFFSG